LLADIHVYDLHQARNGMLDLRDDSLPAFEVIHEAPVQIGDRSIHSISPLFGQSLSSQFASLPPEPENHAIVVEREL
jgi:hypothetical protein